MLNLLQYKGSLYRKASEEESKRYEILTSIFKSKAQVEYALKDLTKLDWTFLESSIKKHKVSNIKFAAQFASKWVIDGDYLCKLPSGFHEYRNVLVDSIRGSIPKYIYRGIQFSLASDLICLDPGDKFHHEEKCDLSSWTPDINIARKYARDGIVYKILNKDQIDIILAPLAQTTSWFEKLVRYGAYWFDDYNIRAKQQEFILHTPNNKRIDVEVVENLSTGMVGKDSCRRLFLKRLGI